MGVVELSLALLIGAALGVLAKTGRGPKLPAFAELLGPGVMAWLCGVQGPLFRQEIDYMVAFLWEGRGRSTLLPYAVWVVACVGLATLGSKLAQAGRPRLALGLGVALAAVGVPFWPRVILMGATLEYSMGVARTLWVQPARAIIVGLTLLASLIPAVGATVTIVLDGLREGRRGVAAPSPPSPPA